MLHQHFYPKYIYDAGIGNYDDDDGDDDDNGIAWRGFIKQCHLMNYKKSLIVEEYPCSWWDLLLL